MTDLNQASKNELIELLRKTLFWISQMRDIPKFQEAQKQLQDYADELDKKYSENNK